MDDYETLHLLHKCRDELRELRQANREMQPRAQAFEVIAQILDMMPRRTGGMAEDVVWHLDRAIMDMERQIQQRTAVADDGGPRSPAEG